MSASKEKLVDDPFRRGQKCKPWEAAIIPELRLQEAVARHYEQVKP